MQSTGNVVQIVVMIDHSVLDVKYHSVTLSSSEICDVTIVHQIILEYNLINYNEGYVNIMVDNNQTVLYS